ncbi:ComEC/Rec2 family competence protein [Rhodophyticola porphyridii]|uniref:ComEC/Rec2 family competence protein n=1 Tax=Rhodophyticola porphyridii TaxID=1852017 RepID=UPI0035D06235
MRLWHLINRLQQGQRGALMPWSPVFAGLGVAWYFGLRAEPGWPVYGAALAVAAVSLHLAWRWRDQAGPIFAALCLVALGLGLAGLRAHLVAGPVLDFRYYGPIEGRIVAIDRSASDALRLTLDQVVLDRTDPARVPRRVRVSLHGDQRWLVPEPGARVMMTGHLSPPEGPAEPGGFDFQRHAWFLQIGAVGYTRNPALLLEPRQGQARPLTHLRLDLSAAIQARIPGDAGAFAAAVLTGDRSGLSTGPLEDMRRSNIAHLLAISGLHMGLLTGFIYAALRFGLALIPALALVYPIRKWAALAALSAGAFYLALSGGNVATERAFIQVAVMFVAVLLDRRAITLRSVAIAALIVLAHRPETLMGPGFQMSFAATTALVAVFNALRDRAWLSGLPVWAKGAAALVISSAVAGAATAPFSAAHFNQIAVYGLVANLLTVPVMGSIVIPAAVFAAVLWPLGLEGLAFWVMEQGLVWILAVAHHVADLPGATRAVMAPPPGVLGLITLGMLLVILWRGRARMLGLAPVAVALAIWSGADRPDLLLSSSGRLAGVLAPEGRALTKPRGDGFVADIWLENDGDPADQEAAASRPGWQVAGTGHSLALPDGQSLWHGGGRRAAREVAEACARHDIVLMSEPLEDFWPDLLPLGRASGDLLSGADGLIWQGRPGGAGGAVVSLARAAPAEFPCLLISGETLRETGAIAMEARDRGLRITSARARQGARLWTGAGQ